MNLWLTQCYLTIIRLVSTTHFDSKATPTTETDYSCNIKAVKLVRPIIWDPYDATSYVLLASGADTQIHMTLTRSISRNQVHQPAAGAHLVYQQTIYVLVTYNLR